MSAPPDREEHITNQTPSQWNYTFGTPPPSHSESPDQGPPQNPLSVAPDVSEVPSRNSHMPVNGVSGPATATRQQAFFPPQHYSGTTMPNFVSPSMWQESVASVYEAGMKRVWDYGDPNGVMPLAKRSR